MGVGFGATQQDGISRWHQEVLAISISEVLEKTAPGTRPDVLETTAIRSERPPGKFFGVASNTENKNTPSGYLAFLCLR